MVHEGLVERAAELDRLVAALEAAGAGRGGVVLVEAAAGMGKSRLLQALRDEADERGLSTLAARGGHVEREFAHGVVRQLLEMPVATRPAAEREALLQGAAALAAPVIGVPAPPGAGAIEPGDVDPGFATLHGLYWLVANLAADGPLVLVVDDAHWADEPSQRFLNYLANRLEGLPVLLVVGTRPAESVALVSLRAAVGADPDAVHLEPGALSEGAIAELTRVALDADPAAEFVSAVRDATGGNPFYVDRLLDTLAADAIAPTADRAGVVGTLGPKTVSHAVLLRLLRLPAGADRVAKAVAVLGVEAELRRVLALADVDLATGAELAQALAQAHILEDRTPLQFAHPIVRQAVDGEIGAAERALLHARAAQLLHTDGVDANRLAPHLLATEPAGEGWRVTMLREAAESALNAGAPENAVRLLKRALREPAPPEERDALSRTLGVAALRAGDPDAVEHLKAATAIGTPAERARAGVLLARSLAAAWRAAEAVDLLEKLADELRGEDAEAALHVEGELASVGLTDSRLSGRAAARLESLGDVAGDTPAQRIVLADQAQQSWVKGTSREQTVELALRALSDGQLLASETSDSVPVLQAIFALIIADAFDEAKEHLDRHLADAERRGSRYGFAAACTLLAIRAARIGEPEIAEGWARAALETDVDHAIVTPMAVGFIVLILLERGAVGEAEELMAAQDFPDRMPDGMSSIHVAFARGCLALARGRVEEAANHLQETADREDAFGIRCPVLPWRPVAALVSTLQGDIERAHALADEQVELARVWGSPRLQGIGLRAKALLSTGPDAIRLHQEAVQTLRGSEAKLDLARSLVDLGSALRRDGRRAEARDLLKEGVELAQQVGAKPLARQAYEELKVAGARPRRLQFSGADSLTASERRVAELAATGRTNREIAQSLFITAKTVENHLGRVYNKLDIASRDALASALAEPVEA